MKFQQRLDERLPTPATLRPVPAEATSIQLKKDEQVRRELAFQDQEMQDLATAVAKVQVGGQSLRSDRKKAKG